MRVGGGQKSDIFDNFSKTALREVSGTTILQTFVILGSILGAIGVTFGVILETFFSSAISDAIFELMGSSAAEEGTSGGSFQDPFWRSSGRDLIRPALWHSAADLKASPLPPAP